MSIRQQQRPGRSVNVMKPVQGRKILSLGLALLILFVLAVVPSAAAGGEFAVGGGRSYAAGRDYVQFGFSVQNTPNRPTSGYITLNWPPADDQPNSAHGQILANAVCLGVNGNEAWAYGVVTKAVNPDTYPDVDWVGIRVKDDETDMFLAFFGYGTAPCTDPTGLYPTMYPLDQGNIVVKD